MAVATATRSSSEAVLASSIAKRTPNPTCIFSNLDSTAILSLSETADGLTAAISDSSSTDNRRSQGPCDAISESTVHPCSSALRSNSASMTVLPKPSWPDMSISRPGAPAPLSSASSKSHMSDFRPTRTGGILPATGVNGFCERSIKNCAILILSHAEPPSSPARSCTNSYRLARSRTISHHQL